MKIVKFEKKKENKWKNIIWNFKLLKLKIEINVQEKDLLTFSLFL